MTNEKIFLLMIQVPEKTKMAVFDHITYKRNRRIKYFNFIYLCVCVCMCVVKKI